MYVCFPFCNPGKLQIFCSYITNIIQLQQCVCYCDRSADEGQNQVIAAQCSFPPVKYWLFNDCCTTEIDHRHPWQSNLQHFISSAGREGHWLIRKLVVPSPGPPISMPKCPWYREWMWMCVVGRKLLMSHNKVLWTVCECRLVIWKSAK